MAELKYSGHNYYPYAQVLQMNLEIQQTPILIIEDDKFTRHLLAEIFRKQGFLHIDEAENGALGFALLQKHRPGLVIADIKMPVMDGFEFCRQVRNHSDPNISQTPVLMQTVLTSSEDRARAFCAGASDYISKPIDENELSARAFVHLERELATRKLREYNQRLTIELETARSTQMVLLPSEQHIQEAQAAYDISVCGYLESCSELAGDFWSIVPLSESQMAVYAVDFSGHGINAALNLFRMQVLMHYLHEIANQPAEYLTRLNGLLYSIIPRGQFATMFYGVIDTQHNRLCYAVAASPEPILFRRDASYEILDGSGMLLGVAKNEIYTQHELVFNKGDSLLLYSDAMLETANDFGHLLDADRIAGFFQRELVGNNHEGKKAFAHLLAHFKGLHMPRMADDLTLVLCQRS